MSKVTEFDDTADVFDDTSSFFTRLFSFKDLSRSPKAAISVFCASQKSNDLNQFSYSKSRPSSSLKSVKRLIRCSEWNSIVNLTF